MYGDYVGKAVRFVIVDDDRDRRFFVRMTLLRRFPAAAVDECQTLAAAVGAVRTFRSDGLPGLAVIHRATDADGLTAVEALRREDAALPLILVSSRAPRALATCSGPARVMSYDNWPTIGLVAEELLAAPMVAAAC